VRYNSCSSFHAPTLRENVNPPFLVH
jgi:hypothetical protein